MNQKSIERGKLLCEIEFRPESYTEDYDIKNDIDQFHLYLDGEEIEFEGP